MSSNDAMSESKSWNDTAPATNEPGRVNHTNTETSRTALNDTQPEAVKQGASIVVKQESTENPSPPPLEPPHVSTNFQAAAEHGDQEPAGITFEHATRQVTPPLLLEGAWQSQDAASETQLKSSSLLAIGSAPTIITSPNHHPSLPMPTSGGIEDSCPTEPTLNRDDCIHNGNAPHEQVSEVEKAFSQDFRVTWAQSVHALDVSQCSTARVYRDDDWKHCAKHCRCKRTTAHSHKGN
jgi:hypothetical protein